MLTSDNGRQFVSKEFEQFLTEMSIQHRRTPPYTPQCNPVERTNRVLGTMIAQYVGKNHKEWDRHITEFCFAYNTAVQESTGYTPAYLNTGREFKTPGEPEETPIPPLTSTPDRIKRLAETHELVRINLARAFQHQAHHYNLRHREWKPRVGDTVWRRMHPLSKKIDAQAAKFTRKFAGPLIVSKIVSPVIVDLRTPGGQTIPHVHIRDLKTNEIPKQNTAPNPVSTTTPLNNKPDPEHNKPSAEKHNRQTQQNR
jgi:Integrase core domain.